MPVERIKEIVEHHAKAPEKRFAQRVLAEEVVTLVHRAEVAQKCIFQTAALYPTPRQNGVSGETRSEFTSESILQAFRGDDIMMKRFSLNSIHGLPVSRLLKAIGLVKSNSTFPNFLRD